VLWQPALDLAQTTTTKMMYTKFNMKYYRNKGRGERATEGKETGCGNVG